MVMCHISEQPYRSLQRWGAQQLPKGIVYTLLHPYVRISYRFVLCGLSHATTCEALYCRGNIDKVGLKSGLHGDNATYSKGI